MSKISEQIQAVQVGKIHILDYGLLHIEEHSTELRRKEGYVYRIDLTVGRVVTCGRDELVYIKDMVVQDINEYLYGDIKAALREAYYALYERDFDKMKQALDTAMETIAV